MKRIITTNVIQYVAVDDVVLTLDSVWQNQLGVKVIITQLTAIKVKYYNYPIGQDKSRYDTHENFILKYPNKGSK